jgi:endoglucanase
MKPEITDILLPLLAQASPSGSESALIETVRKAIAACADSIHRDATGNLVATVNPGAQRKIMLSAHTDEVGLMVMHIDERGFLWFAPVGSVDPAVLPARQVTVHTSHGPVNGVIGRKAIHQIEPEDRGKTLRVSDMWIDVGAASGDDAKSVVAVGDYASLRTEPASLRNGIVTGRGIDNRAGVAVLVRTLLNIRGRRPDVTVIAVFSVQEELGSRGARTAAFAVEPDAAIAIDVGHATDYPGAEPRRFGDCRVGAGPILYRGPNIHPGLGAMLEETAASLRMKVQVLAEPRPTPTEADPLQISRAGVPATVVKVPLRHMHTPAEVASAADIENLAKLLSRFLLSLKTDSPCFERRRF